MRDETRQANPSDSSFIPPAFSLGDPVGGQGRFTPPVTPTLKNVMTLSMWDRRDIQGSRCNVSTCSVASAVLSAVASAPFGGSRTDLRPFASSP